jgi:ubiquinone/menaquinone biosynthesis C-methylase UbiE
MRDSRIQNEKEFHDKLFEDDEYQRTATRKYYSICKNVRDKYIEAVFNKSKGKSLLEYGCGTGSFSRLWSENGAIVTGIDISPEGIQKAEDISKNAGFDAEYYVMNAEKTEFQEDRFDIIVGMGIIHHLDLKQCYKELQRILKEGGQAIFIEPLGHNPIINLYRSLTPRMRTEDEHPLMVKDIKLIEEYFQRVEVHYYILFALMAVPFRDTKIFKTLLACLESIDNIVFRVPFFRRYAWQIIIHASHPIKD